MAGKVTYKPLGARLLVEPIITTLSLEERGARVGLEVIVENDNRPRPSTGKVVALGSDPLMRELIKEGDIVFFHPYDGSDVTLAGVIYRQLELPMINGVMSEEEYLTTEQSAE